MNHNTISLKNCEPLHEWSRFEEKIYTQKVGFPGEFSPSPDLPTYFRFKLKSHMNLLGLKGLLSSEPRKALADNTGNHNLSGSAANSSSHALKMIPTSAQLMTPDQLDAAEKISVGQLNILDPNLYQWLVVQGMSNLLQTTKTKASNDLLVCPTDDIQNPIAWFKVNLILEDANDKTNAIIIGQIKLFQLRLGKVKNDTSRNDLLIQTVFKDQTQIRPLNNNKDDEAISNLGKKHMVHEMLPSTLPFSLKKSLPSSLTESSSSSKKRQREPVKKSLFTSTPTKKPKSDTTSGYSEETYAFEETDDENVANTDKTPSE
ncbi:hypothetical protein C1H46_017067 [Malus baccata]|uniref:Uncharacterized protein n=1 Tax=Malus baccata TaxID=106549 RepID=A0A540MFY0_MALBA|nr:hypothetical protein C1H46_017067 [Malus baccata]